MAKCRREVTLQVFDDNHNSSEGRNREWECYESQAARTRLARMVLVRSAFDRTPNAYDIEVHVLVRGVVGRVVLLNVYEAPGRFGAERTESRTPITGLQEALSKTAKGTDEELTVDQYCR